MLEPTLLPEFVQNDVCGRLVDVYDTGIAAPLKQSKIRSFLDIFGDRCAHLLCLYSAFDLLDGCLAGWLEGGPWSVIALQYCT